MSNPNSPTDDQPVEVDRQLDRTFKMLADPHRRHALFYLVEMDGVTTDVSDLLEYVAACTADSYAAVDDDERLRLRFQRVHLPKLDDAGIIDYDARSNTIRYDSRPRVEAILALAIERGMTA